MIDGEYIRERREFFTVLVGIIAIFAIFALIYTLNGDSWGAESDSVATAVGEARLPVSRP